MQAVLDLVHPCNLSFFNNLSLPVILRRYMTRQVASTTALVLGFLVVLLLGGRMIRYFGIAAEGRLDVGLLFSIIGYNLPYFLELVLPLSFFIGLMLVFGRLYVDHEMAVLNGSGISRGRLARLMIPLILVLFVLEAGLSLYGKPWGVKNSESIWQQQSLSSAFDLIRPQTFINSDDYHLYVGSMNDNKTELQDVILIQTAKDAAKSVKPGATVPEATTNAPAVRLGQQELEGSNSANQSVSSIDKDKAITAVTNPVAASQDKPAAKPAITADDDRDIIVLAKRAVQVKGSEESGKTQLDLFQGRRYEVGADSLVYSQIGFERYRISINQPPADVLTEENVTTQSVPALWKAATGQKVATKADGSTEPEPQQILSAQAELGYRLALPWLIILAPMLAVPLAQVRPRQGRWLRLLPAILIFTSCVLVIISLKNAITKGTLSVLSYPLVLIGFIVLALYLNWASRIHHRVRFRLGQRALQSQTNHSSNPDINQGGRS